jgi:NAD(P)-dependent dehydrogenase (short-subunit alcohol dehydrogenase family)
MQVRPVVLVTGAARRLGREIALHLAAHGYNLAVHYRGSAEEAEDTVAQARHLGADAWAFCADLSDETACCTLVPAVVDHFGRLDAVVNNASTFEHDTAATFTHAAMDLHWRANTAPAVFLAQALHDHLSERAQSSADRRPDRSGCVVNLLDMKLWNLNPDHFSYTLSKAALETAGQMLARSLAPLVRVCGVAPGITLPSGPMTEAEFASAHRLTPLGRSSTTADIARAVHFLLESPAITGHTLLVDGGQHLQTQGRDVLYVVNPSKDH